MAFHKWLLSHRNGQRFKDRLSAIRQRREFGREYPSDRSVATGFIYGLFDQSACFYVGKTNDTGRRLQAYRKAKSHGNFYLGCRLRDLDFRNFDMRILETVRDAGISDKRLRRREKYWIQRMTAAGHKLCNRSSNPRTRYRLIDNVACR